MPFLYAQAPEGNFAACRRYGGRAASRGEELFPTRFCGSGGGLSVKGKKAGAIDLGGTHVRAALLNESWEIERMVKEETFHGDCEEGLVNQLCRMIRSLTEASEELISLGVGIPGVVERSGRLRYIVNIPELNGVNLGGALEEKLGIPVYSVNDASAAALAEARMGAGKNFESVYYITVSTGIGGGFVFKGQVLEGAFGYAGEVGGILVRKEEIAPKKEASPALFPGSVETLASGTALTRQGSRITGQKLKHAGEVFAAAAVGQKWADDLVSQMAWDLAMMCVDISYTVNPEVFVFGGGCMTEGNPFFEQMCYFYRQIADEGLHKTRFLRAILAEPGIMGAAMYGQRRKR